MLSLLSVGFAQPAAQIDNSFLGQLDSGLSEALIFDTTGVRTRYSTLPLDYIRETANQAPARALAVSTASPSALGAEAARKACEQTGVALTDIGLILSDTVTPYEVCPSEGPRIGNLLGVKIPAYDILGGSASLAYQLESLLSWKKERLPKYILCVSTNTPSHYVNYLSGDARMMFGDGASAFLLSPSEKGAFVVDNAFAERFCEESGAHFPLNGAVEVSSKKLGEIVQRITQIVLERTGSLIKAESTAVVLPQVAPRLLGSLAVEHGLSEARLMSCAAECADMIGTGPGAALARNWQRALGFSHVALILAGVGGSGGAVVLRRQE